MSFIRSADAALYYEEYGAGETLVLLPGLFGTIELDWRRFIPAFSRHFHTIAVDLRGHGKTDNPSGKLSPARLVADLNVLFETLEIDRAFLCTHGAMAFLPLAFAAAHPERVSGIILHAPRGTLAAGDTLLAVGDATAASLLTGFPADTLERAHGPEGWKRLIAQSNELLAPTGMPDGDLLRTLRIPILITTGEDPGRVSRDEFPLADVDVIPRCGPLITTVPKAPFLSAVLGFAARAAESFSGQKRTPE